MSNKILIEIMTELKSNSLDIRKLKLENNNLKKTCIQLINSINDLKNDIDGLNNRFKEYETGVNEKVDSLSKRIKDIEEYDFKNLSQLNNSIDFTNKEFLKFKEELDLVKNNNNHTILNNKLKELEKLLTESNSDLFDTIVSLEEEFDDFKEEIEDKIEGIFDISNMDFNDFYSSDIKKSTLDFNCIENSYNINIIDYDEELEKISVNKDLTSTINFDDVLFIENNEETEEKCINEISDEILKNIKIDNIDTKDIDSPKKYLTIRDLDGFYKYRDIIHLYDLESKYIFLGSENVFNNYDILLINAIKILNNKYRKELSEFIKCEENKFLYEGNPLNLTYTSKVVSLREIYDDLAGEGDIYIVIPENHTEIIHLILLVVSYIENKIEDNIKDITFNFTFNEDNYMLYKEKVLEKQSGIDSNKDLECKQEEILDISSMDYHERVSYYPSKKQKRKLEKLLKNSDYELKIDFNNLNRKEVASIINIIDKNSRISKEDEHILFKFLKTKNNINTIDKDYFTKLVLDGYTNSELSEIFNVSTNIIHNKKKEFGLINIKKSLKENIDDELFKELLKNGYTTKMLAKEFGVSESIINNKKKELSLVKNYENLKDISEVKLENISYEYFTNTIPIRLYINNKEFNITKKTWVETYLKMCDYLISLDEENFIKHSSRLTSYGSSPYFSYYQFNLNKSRKLSNNSYYAEVGLSAYTFISNIRYLIRKMELSEDIFYIEFIDK